MDLFRLLFAPFVPPLIYGLICTPLSQFVLTLFPNAVTAQGEIFHVGATLAIEVTQAITLLLAGIALSAVAPRDRHWKTIVIISTIGMLCIGILVQLEYWTAMLSWHHYVFFALILTVMPLGAIWHQRIERASVDP